MKHVIHSALKYSMLLLFISYCVNINFFTHIHVVNGVTIVHSHIHKDGAGDKSHPKHGHKSSEIQLIWKLSHFVSTGEIVASFFVDNSPHHIQNPTIQKTAVFSTHFEGKYYLRPPPYLLS